MTTAPPRWPAGPGTEPEALIKEARRRQHRRWLAAGSAMAVLVAGTATAALIAGSGGGTSSPPPIRHAAPTVPAHAVGTLMTVSQTSLPGWNSLGLAVGYQAVWVTGIGVTYQVDEVTGRLVRTIPTPGTSPDGCGLSGIAAGAGAVWVATGCQGIYRIDPYTGRVTARLRVPGAEDAIAVAAGLLWVTSENGDLLRIQPRTGQLVGKAIPVGFGDWTLVPAVGALWVTSYGSGVLGGTVSRVDLATGAVQLFGNFDVEAAGAGSLWTPQVQRIDPATGNVMASVPVPGMGDWGVPGASQVVFWDGSVWALSMQESLTVLRIDPGTDHVAGEPVLVGHPFPAALAWTSNPTAFVAGPTGLWVLDFDRNLLVHLAIRPARP